jgi:site-specific DNA recombinase
MKRAAIYTRVSTEDQSENGTSLDSQLDACRKFALANGWQIVAELKEQGASGATLARPQLDKLRDLVGDGLVDVVVIYKLDRLSRDTGQMLGLLKEFGKHNVALKSATVQIEDTPEGVMLLTMLAAMGAYERTQIMERSRRGKEARVRQGKVVGTTMPPYAFRYIIGEGRFELDEGEGQIVREIFDGVVNRGLSLYEVARRLNERHVPTPRGGDVWRKSTIRGILRNPIYSGRYTWGRTRSVAPKNPRKANHNGETKTTNQPRPQEEWIVVPDVVVRLVSDAMFEQVQAQLQRNQVLSKRSCTHEYLLRGFVRCGYCGGTLRGHINNGTRKYECYRREQRGDPEAQRCPSKTYHADRLEAIVWEALEQYITDPALLARIADEKEPGREKAEKLEAAQLANLQTARAKVEAQLDKLLDLYVDGALPKEKYELKAKPLTAEAERLDREIGTIQLSVLIRDFIIVPKLTYLEMFCKYMKHAVKTLTFEEKRRLLELSNIKISVTADAIHVGGAFTTDLLNVSIEADLDTDQLMRKGKPAPTGEAVEAIAGSIDGGENDSIGGPTDPLSTHYQYPQPCLSQGGHRRARRRGVRRDVRAGVHGLGPDFRLHVPFSLDLPGGVDGRERRKSRKVA